MLDTTRGLYVAHCENGPINILGKMANRHGLVAGATGTGKTLIISDYRFALNRCMLFDYNITRLNLQGFFVIKLQQRWAMPRSVRQKQRFVYNSTIN